MEKSDRQGSPRAEGKSKTAAVSPMVIRRLSRYFRYLRELIRNGRMRISSNELAKMMHVTASQIRQDLNCFGGFGQQGYGYNVNYLYTKICELLGVGEGYQAIVIGAGNLGKALVNNPMFEKRGVDIVALFDVSPEVVGKRVGNLLVRDMAELEAFCREHPVDMAVLTCPKESTDGVAARLAALGVGAFWNFTGKELDHFVPAVVVENVHLGDSLMTLCYEMRCKDKETEEK